MANQPDDCVIRLALERRAGPESHDVTDVCRTLRFPLFPSHRLRPLRLLHWWIKRYDTIGNIVTQLVYRVLRWQVGTRIQQFHWIGTRKTDTQEMGKRRIVTTVVYRLLR